MGDALLSAAAMKIIGAAVAPAIGSIVAWSTVIAQIDDVGGTSTLVPAGIVTASSGAMVYIVKKFTSGDLVFRNVAEAEAAMVKIAEQLVKLADENERLAMEAAERERRLFDIATQAIAKGVVTTPPTSD